MNEPDISVMQKPLHNVLKALLDDRRQQDSVTVMFATLMDARRLKANAQSMAKYESLCAALRPTLRQFDAVIECPPLGFGLVLKGLEEPGATVVRDRWCAVLQAAGLHSEVKLAQRRAGLSHSKWADELLARR